MVDVKHHWNIQIALHLIQAQTDFIAAAQGSLILLCALGIQRFSRHLGKSSRLIGWMELSTITDGPKKASDFSVKEKHNKSQDMSWSSTKHGGCIRSSLGSLETFLVDVQFFLIRWKSKIPMIPCLKSGPILWIREIILEASTLTSIFVFRFLVSISP